MSTAAAPRERRQDAAKEPSDDGFDVDAEFSLLSCLAVNPALVMPAVREAITSADFGGPGAAIYEAMGELYADGGDPSDITALAQQLKVADDWPLIGMEGLSKLLESVPSAKNYRVFLEAIQRKTRERGVQRIVDLARSAISRGDDPLSVAAAMRTDADEFALSGATAEERFGVIDGEEFDAAQFEIRYLIEGVLVENQPLVLAGVMKSMKTTVALDLAMSLALGEPFLGKFRVPQPRRVMVISGESGKATIQETCRRICAAKGRTLAETRQQFLFSDYIPCITDPHELAALESIISRAEVDVLLCDPAYLMMDGVDAGNLFVQGARLRAFSNMCARRKVTPVLCHHARKGVAEGERLELGSISFSGFAEFGRQFLLLNRRRKYAFDGCHDLWMSLGGSAGHGGIWGVDIVEGVRSDERPRIWQTKLLSVAEVEAQSSNGSEQRDEERRRAKVTKDARAIVNVMIKHTDGETERRIREGAGMSGQRAGQAFALLRADGAIEDCQIERNGRTYGAVKLVQDWCE